MKWSMVLLWSLLYIFIILVDGAVIITRNEDTNRVNISCFRYELDMCAETIKYLLVY